MDKQITWCVIFTVAIAMLLAVYWVFEPGRIKKAKAEIEKTEPVEPVEPVEPPKPVPTWKKMQQWNETLGVECSYCHVRPYSKNLEDLAGETVTEEDLNALMNKKIAESMEAEMEMFNETESKNLTCGSCH